MNSAPLLLVLGMHRSGTSLLCGILQRLGVSLVGETITGDEHNPEGYFEWDTVVDLQERLLIDLQRWWPAAEGTLALPDGWLHAPVTRRAYDHLRSNLAEVMAQQQGLWAIKDPRCSRLLPLWVELARDLEIPLRLLLAVRDPAEVVTSLMRRDGPLTGMDINRAQQLWWRHNLEPVETATNADLPLAVVDFDRWFQEPEQQLEHLVQLLPELNPSLAQRQHACSLIKPEHRRSLSLEQQPRLQGCVRKLHARLLRNPLPQFWPPVEPSFGDKKLSVSSVSAVSVDQPNSWPAWLVHHRYFPAPRLTHSFCLAEECCLSVCGSTWKQLWPHLLLQHAPLPGLYQRRIDLERAGLHSLYSLRSENFDNDPVDTASAVERLTLNLELPPSERACHWLAHLQSQQLILDPEPSRVLLLRALGLPAWWLDPSGEINGWLQQPQAVDPRQWASRLGLVPPASGNLMVLGPAGAVFEQGLAHEAALAEPESPFIDYCPGWPELLIDDSYVGLLRAGWLQSAATNSVRLVHAGAERFPAEWELLCTSQASLADLLDATPAELRARHRGHLLMALAEDRPMPPLHICREWQVSDFAERPPLAAVVVSLHNYADCITAALESVRTQTLHCLELIVVDDASSDQGVAVVQQWIDVCLQAGEHPFVRVLLIRHAHNSGLAAARNTAFAHSDAPWCFVLDADNALFPEAVERCLTVADVIDSKLAVVHPLLAVDVGPGRLDDQRTLVSSASWQRERLIKGNVVDAMALIRRSAWEAVGGYTHIEGGWEDYDFWCKLVEAGYYGLQCPRVLAVYRSHAESMSHRSTNRSWHALSRTLQKRHPWLQLPLIKEEQC